MYIAAIFQLENCNRRDLFTSCAPFIPYISRLHDHVRTSHNTNSVSIAELGGLRVRVRHTVSLSHRSCRNSGASARRR